MKLFENVPCIKCGEMDSMSLYLDESTFHCRECEDDTPLEDVEEAIEAWTAIIQWTKAAPSFVPQQKETIPMEEAQAQ